MEVTEVVSDALELDFHLLHLLYFKNTRICIKGVICTLIFLSAILRVASAANNKIVSLPLFILLIKDNILLLTTLI